LGYFLNLPVLPKENNRPVDENPPKMVTLSSSQLRLTLINFTLGRSRVENKEQDQEKQMEEKAIFL
jgi:hypothetical protein